MVELLVVDDKNDTATETFNGLHESLCLLLVVRGEAIDDRPGREHLWKDGTD